MRVTYVGDFTSPSGYSRATRNHARALMQAGVDVTGVQTKHDRTDVILDDFWSERMAGVLSGPRGTTININHNTPEFYTNIHPANYNIAMLTFEADKIPNYDVQGNPKYNWVKQINKMSEVWTFSSYMVDVFRKSGVRKEIPIHVFPHPIDIEKYKPGPGVALYDGSRKVIESDCFKFMSIFQTSKRKNPWALLSAYMSEFSAKDNVVLIIKTYGPDFSERSRKSVVEQMGSFSKFVSNRDGLPTVLLQLEPMSDDEMPGFIRSADCHVSAAYAEGFGLPVQESLACGIPCIVPDSSAFPDLVNWDRGWLINTYVVPIVGQVHTPWYQTYQGWWEVDLIDMMAHMRSAYKNRDGLKELGENAREHIVSRYTFDLVGENMRKRLNEIQNGL